MIYTVTWLPSAEDELTDLWLDPTTRADVSAAANQIDRLLRHDPDQVGESRGDETRILFAPPLGVLFRVKPMDRQVEILHAWAFA